MEGQTEGRSQRRTPGRGASDGQMRKIKTSEEMLPHMEKDNVNRGGRSQMCHSFVSHYHLHRIAVKTLQWEVLRGNVPHGRLGPSQNQYQYNLSKIHCS